jgi:hydroxymethylpyrimidine/phosphomethylpyrimidine kinase
MTSLQPTILPACLTIAGSDSGGGAGIQADLKAFHANGVFGMSVVVSVTAQNTITVTESYDLPLKVIRAQLEAVFSDIQVAAAKTGMLSSAAIVDEFTSFWSALRSPPPLVVDPVMISKSGYPLLKPEAVEKVRRRLLPLATVVTPNLHEAELLAEQPIRDRASALTAGRRILDLGPQAVLLKGGHLPVEPGEATRATDVLFDATGVREFSSERFETSSTHGTGCTFSAAICAGLGRGLSLEEAVSRAKIYITGAIRHGLKLGHGHGPTHHFYFLPDPTALHGRG